MIYITLEKQEYENKYEERKTALENKTKVEKQNKESNEETEEKEDDIVYNPLRQNFCFVYVITK